MPTYEYRCGNCGHEFEKFQSIKAGAIRKCPECGKMKVRRLISTGGGVIFKGSGFYETDYRSSSYRKEAEKDKDKSGKKDNNQDTKKKSGDETSSTGGSKGSKDSGGSDSKGKKKDK